MSAAGRAVIRRLSFVAMLGVTATMMGPASASLPAPCGGPRCEAAGTVLWTRPLPGQWAVRNGLMGTTPVQGQAYAALGSQVAAVGSGMTVEAYSAGTGRPLWTANLRGFPAGAAIMSVRVWPAVVTVGVSLRPPGTAGQDSTQREEVLLRAATGHRIRAYPAAPFGGAVAAGPVATVIVGARAVTSYANRNGRVLWSRPTGPVPQAWVAGGDHLYMAVAAGGYLSTAPVTALRQIDLRTGRQRVVQAPRHAFSGRLGLAFDGVVLFTSADGVTAYDGVTGARLWQRDGSLPESADMVTRRLYLLDGNVLSAVDPRSGGVLTRVSGAAAVASSGLFGVRGGVVLGLDHGAQGKAWGYDAAAGRVIWTSAPLPWAHYFVDLSGLGGSASSSWDGVLLAVCAEVRSTPPAGGAQQCARPELVVLSR